MSAPYPFCPVGTAGIKPTQPDTYVIESPSQVPFGTHLGSITDAVTGVETAHFLNALGTGHFALAIGVPLCGQCDEPVHGRCDCCDPVMPPRRLAPVVAIKSATLRPDQYPNALTDAVFAAAKGVRL